MPDLTLIHKILLATVTTGVVWEFPFPHLRRGGRLTARWRHV